MFKNCQTNQKISNNIKNHIFFLKFNSFKTTFVKKKKKKKKKKK